MKTLTKKDFCEDGARHKETSPNGETKEVRSYLISKPVCDDCGGDELGSKFYVSVEPGDMDVRCQECYDKLEE